MKYDIKLFLLLLATVGVICYIFFQKDTLPITLQKTPKAKADTILYFSPQPIYITSSVGKADIIMDTGSNTIEFVQLRLLYSPQLISKITFKKGTLLQKADILNSYIDKEKGTATFLVSIPKKIGGVKGKGVAATVVFETFLQRNERMNIAFSEETMVSDSSSEKSVLKNASGTQIIRENQ